jgi:hypothetical protein
MPINPRSVLGVPPDGAGKKIQVAHSMVVDYSGASSANPFAHGDTVVGQTSGTEGKVIRITSTGPSTGQVIIFADPKHGDQELYTVGEALLVNSVALANVASIESKYISSSTIVSGYDPNNHLYIDEAGALSVRFNDGNPSLDLMGSQTTSDYISLGSYSSPYEEGYYFGYIETGLTAHSHDTDTRGVVISTTSGAGSKITRRTNWTHYYQLGASVVMRTAVAIPDWDKTLVNRRWGLFDDDNGMGFAAKNGVLGIFTRTNSSGATIETFVPQAEWNIDVLNGTDDVDNISSLLIDPAQLVDYWIEYRWHGTLSARFGVYIESKKVAVHEFEWVTTDLSDLPYASFPLSYEVENTGAVLTPTEMIIYSGSVESSQPITTWTIPNTASNELKTISYASGFTPLLSIRAAELYHGIRNDTWAGITQCDIASLTTDFADDSWVIVKAVYDPVLTGASWASAGSESSVEFDVTATAADISSSEVIATWMVKGAHVHKFPSPTIYDADGVGLNADGTPSTISIVARPLVSATSSSVAAILSWEELR